MSMRSGDLIKEAFGHADRLTHPELFDSSKEFSTLLFGQTIALIRAAQFLNTAYFQQPKVDEIERAYPKIRLFDNYYILDILEPHRNIYPNKREVRDLDTLRSIYPTQRNETSRMNMKMGSLGQGQLSYKSVPLRQRSEYSGIFPQKVLNKDRIILQPLTTIARPITVTSYGNSHTPLDGTIYQSALHTIRSTGWTRGNPELIRDISTRIIWSNESAATLKIQRKEMKVNQIIAHLLLAEAIINPAEGSAFSSND